MPRKKSHSGATSGPSKSTSQRMLRVGEMMRHVLADMLTRGDIHDDVLAAHVITISEVRMTPDLKLATVFVMPLGGGDIEPVLEALDNNRRYIRSELAHAINLKFAPDVRFREDKSFADGHRIDRLLDSPAVRRDVENK